MDRRDNRSGSGGGRGRDSRGGGGRGGFGGRGGGRGRGGFGGRGRDSRGGGGRGGFDRPREMHKAKCAECGKECEVPFKPTQGRPVYCRECFAKKREKEESEY